MTEGLSVCTRLLDRAPVPLRLNVALLAVRVEVRFVSLFLWLMASFDREIDPPSRPCRVRRNDSVGLLPFCRGSLTASSMMTLS